MNVLGIVVSRALVEEWKHWLAPPVQLFFVESPRDWPGVPAGELTAELADTCKVWRPAFAGKQRVWLDEAAFRSLPRRRQRELRRGRTVVWPSEVTDDVVRCFVESENVASRHREVDWKPSRALVPRARKLAGAFPVGSGPNCFGTTMAAAGVDGAEDEWMQVRPFEAWLRAHAHRGGGDAEPGTVLLWRDVTSGRPYHSAITLGGGWALEKPAQYWWAPRYVATVADVKRVNRMRGLRLERWSIAR